MSEAAIDLRVPDLATLHLRRSEKWSGQDPDVLASTVAEMDFPLAAEITAALHAAIDRHDLGYTPPREPELPAAFADFARRRLGWTVDQDRITLVPDVMAGIIELCRVLLTPGEQVAFFTPAYPPFLDELPQARVELVYLPLGPDGVVDLDALKAALARGVRALVLANPHNPTGRVPPRAELERIAELCASHDCWVIADEIHAPLVLDGATHTPWLEVSDAAREQGIALSSASKTFNVAGLKTALMITASERARAAVERVPPLTDRVGILGVIAAEAGFRYGDRWLDAVLDQLTANRQLLGDLLATELPKIKWTSPEASYLAWLDCRALGLGDNPAEAFLARGRVALGRGLDFGREGAGFARLNFGTSPDHVAEAVRRMARVVG
ncbi:MAG TPA: aminotransferase class I/II-fold pyridoxal phosphate-dependent enzyme [Propionibacteriaceae bacterium]|nr:aminotransferase class I/II-fold pyridoxal phosphate-dependent enzyme [Propionibacteriaceae bacterium]